MRRVGLIVSVYLIRTIVPLFFFSWLLLSVILFVQQAGRFSDIFFSANIPSALVWQLMLALVPNVIAFTCPMAILVGTVIGLAKMQGDSELVALRSAGVGNLQIMLPIALLGVVLSVFAFLVNLKGVPFASALVRQVALRTAIQKLESPIEPGIFNTEVAGYTIFVRSGDIATGRWQDIFVYQTDAGGSGTRLITSREGRIDFADQVSELVLEDASVLTLPPTSAEGKYVSERIGDVRLAIKTRRNELVERLTTAQGGLEEMGLSQLSDFASSREGGERLEAQILLQRRILLSITPLMFCLLGTAMVLRLNRGGRGLGVFLSLAALIVYYLLAFLGEQLIRVGNASPLIGGLLPIGVSLLLILWFYLAPRTGIFSRVSGLLAYAGGRLGRVPNRIQFRNVFVDLTTGLRDLDLVGNLIKYFLLSLAFTGMLFVVFTAFELWKFAGTMDGGIALLVRYLFYLSPFVYLQLAPTCAMIAILATYIIKSRNNELVTWISAGQSVYRLLLPSLAACLALGLVSWLLQETILPTANALQDEARTRLRTKGAVATQNGKYWMAVGDSIYSFQLDTAASDNEETWLPNGRKNENNNVTSDNVIERAPDSRQEILASDNEKQLASFTAYVFSADKAKLQSVYRSNHALWSIDEIRFNDFQRISLNDSGVTVDNLNGGSLPADNIELAGLVGRPSHLTTRQLTERIKRSDSETESRMLEVLLHRRYATALLPLIVGLLAASFALNLGRKGKVLMAGYAVGVWLVYMGLSSVFEQWGSNGQLPPVIAVWAPLLLFGGLGIFLLSRIRT